MRNNTVADNVFAVTKTDLIPRIARHDPFIHSSRSRLKPVLFMTGGCSARFFSRTDYGDIHMENGTSVSPMNAPSSLYTYHPTDVAPGYRDLHNMLLSYHESIYLCTVSGFTRRVLSFFFTFSMSSH